VKHGFESPGLLGWNGSVASRREASSGIAGGEIPFPANCAAAIDENALNERGLAANCELLLALIYEQYFFRLA
jgi:hypothetical protein